MFSPTCTSLSPDTEPKVKKNTFNIYTKPPCCINILLCNAPRLLYTQPHALDVAYAAPALV